MSISIFGYVVLLTLLLAAGSSAIEFAIEGRGVSRHVWTAAIALSLVAPPVALAWRVYSQLHLPTLPGGVAAGPLTAVASAGVNHGVASVWAAILNALAAILSTEVSARVAAGVWILASIALLGWVCAAALYWRRASRAWRQGTLDGVQVALAPSTGPAVLGVLSHRIVIPAWTEAMAPEHRRLVLAHESEHIRSRDPQRLAVATAALILTPWNVALWWCAARLRRAIELDCDARVLRTHPDAREYGYVLLEVAARGRNIGPLAVPMVALLRMPSDLERRLRAISGARNSGRRTALFGALSVAVLVSAAFTTPVPLIRPVARAAPIATGGAQQLPNSSRAGIDTLPADDRTYRAKEVDSPASILSDSPVPAYPAAARKLRLNGEVRVAFVVGVDGRVERGSTRIVKSNSQLFTDAVTTTLPRMRFKPAEYKGRRVKQIVEQPFTFVLAPDK